MKTRIKPFVVIGASTFLLAGCYTAHRTAHWEYKVVASVPSGNANTSAPPNWEKSQESMMNNLAKDGWIFIISRNHAVGDFSWDYPVKAGRFSTALQLGNGLRIFCQSRRHQARSRIGTANLMVVLPRG